LPNTKDGVRVFGNAGDIVVDSNLISGNKLDGVALDTTSVPSIVAHNLIGLSAVLGNLGNGANGVEIRTSSNTIAGNHIWFNTSNGVQLFGGSSNQIQGNSIAFNQEGVLLEDSANSNAIGGINPGQGNTIFNNKSFGVVVASSFGDAIEGNRILANGGGIILISGNNQQASPTLLFAAYNGIDNTTVIGTLHATASTTYRIEFFDNPSGGNQGQKFLGFIAVTTDTSGNATLVADFAGAGTGSITATATDSGGDTSVFSQAVAVALL
jgi:hypothetical protein